jgi:hypothetical protein
MPASAQRKPVLSDMATVGAFPRSTRFWLGECSVTIW